MDNRINIETMKIREAASLLGTTEPVLKSAILNGTCPIGAVGSGRSNDRIIIVKKRFEAWINADDLIKKN